MESSDRLKHLLPIHFPLYHGNGNAIHDLYTSKATPTAISKPDLFQIDFSLRTRNYSNCLGGRLGGIETFKTFRAFRLASETKTRRRRGIVIQKSKQEIRKASSDRNAFGC